MDTNKLIQRARAILVTPRAEWPVIGTEPTGVAELYQSYILVLAAISPVCRFIKTSLIGYAWHGFRVYRLGIGSGLADAAVAYLLALVVVYVVALVIDGLAQTFGSQSNRLQALKLAAYSFTPLWVAGFAQLLPGVYPLVALVAALYGVYLLYLGLPMLMRAPQERVGSYAAVVAAIALVLGWLVGEITGGVTGVSPGDYS